jgi:hypothetical protein
VVNVRRIPSRIIPRIAGGMILSPLICFGDFVTIGEITYRCIAFGVRCAFVVGRVRISVCYPYYVVYVSSPWV